MFRVIYIQLMLNSLVCNFLACSSIPVKVTLGTAQSDLNCEVIVLVGLNVL